MRKNKENAMGLLAALFVLLSALWDVRVTLVLTTLFLGTLLFVALRKHPEAGHPKETGEAREHTRQNDGVW